MPPVTILSPYSGRPVIVREQDLGRAIRDEQGRVFYVVEDPEHGRYAARTRKGSIKDLERYRKIESDTAKLAGEFVDADAPRAKAFDARGTKRRSPMGLIVLVLILAGLIAAGYIYLNHPQWLGLDEPVDQTGDEPQGNRQGEPSEQYTQNPRPTAGQHVAIGFTHQPTTAPASPQHPPQPTADTPRDASKPGFAAAPLTNNPPNHHQHELPLSTSSMPASLDPDPTPIIVKTRARASYTWPKERQPRTVPITLAAAQAQPTNYDDFRHTASGLRYKITHLTDGVSARAGNYLTVRYTAQTLDGKPLIDDASQSFILASGQAIRALDEGLAGIRQGEQLRLLVPRGHSEAGTLPGIERIPDQPFLMDVQLVSVRPGVTHIIEHPGNIDSPPAMPGDTLLLNYLARVEGQDEIIDATVHRGQPMRITLGNNEVIPGLELGITGMRAGESRQLTIPPYLAYGKHSVAGGLIPPHAVLNFRVTLVKIVEDNE